MYRVKFIAKVLSLLVLLIATTALADVFRWTDDSGQQHFSDRMPAQANDDAEVVAPERYQSPPVGWQGTTPAAPTRDTSSNATSNQSDAAYYSQLRVLEPANDATFWSAPGEVQVVLALNPPLRDTDRIMIYVDGAPHGTGFAETTIRLQNIDRGTHSLSATVTDSSGRILMRSATHNFHLHRPSIR
jgi:hypothetical protein